MRIHIAICVGMLYMHTRPYTQIRVLVYTHPPYKHGYDYRHVSQVCTHTTHEHIIPECIYVVDICIEYTRKIIVYIYALHWYTYTWIWHWYGYA